MQKKIPSLGGVVEEEGRSAKKVCISTVWLRVFNHCIHHKPRSLCEYNNKVTTNREI